MKLEDQVASLELCKKLKELGVKQESYFLWVGDQVWDQTMQSDYEVPNTPSRDTWVSAFTVAELGEMLPDHLELSISKRHFKHEPPNFERYTFSIMHTMYYTCYACVDQPQAFEGYDNSEANARALTLIQLIENGITHYKYMNKAS